MHFHENVKIDSKGRITIPAYIRLALGIESGDKLLLIAYPDRGSIEIRKIYEDAFSCSGTIGINDFIALLRTLSTNNIKIYAITCTVSGDGEEYRCSLVVSSDISANTRGLYCEPLNEYVNEYPKFTTGEGEDDWSMQL